MSSYHKSGNKVLCLADHYSDCEYGIQCTSYPLKYRCEHKRRDECMNSVVRDMAMGEVKVEVKEEPCMEKKSDYNLKAELRKLIRK